MSWKITYFCLQGMCPSKCQNFKEKSIGSLGCSKCEYNIQYDCNAKTITCNHENDPRKGR